MYLNCIISSFLNHRLIQDLSTKQVIGKGRESKDLYILDPEVPKFITCYEVVTTFELHCRLGHPSLSLLKKVYILSFLIYPH